MTTSALEVRKDYYSDVSLDRSDPRGTQASATFSSVPLMILLALALRMP